MVKRGEEVNGQGDRRRNWVSGCVQKGGKGRQRGIRASICVFEGRSSSSHRNNLVGLLSSSCFVLMSKSRIFTEAILTEAILRYMTAFIPTGS